MTAIIAFLTGEFGKWLAIAGAALAALWAYGIKRARDGRRKEQDEQAKEDAARAAGIRDRIRDVDQRLREFDDAGFRD